MKTEIFINGKETEIELNDSQAEKIARDFNKKQLDKLPATERIKTLQDALDYKGETLEQFNKRTEHDQDHEKAYKELCLITWAMNGGKWMDYSDTSVYKYYPYFRAAGSGSGFAYADYDCACDDSNVGARLCVDTAEKAEYMGTQFLSIYNRYINN